MSFETSFLRADANAYVERHLRLPYAVMDRMEEAIRREGQPAVGRAAGAFLRSLAAATQARRILEVGTNLGYSGLWLLSGAPADARLDTIEMDAAIAARARAHFDAAGVGARVTVHEARALDALARARGPYDLIFLDAAKSEYPAYLERAARLLRPGGVVAADNAFWSGRVWDAANAEPDTRGVRAMTEAAFAEPRWAASFVPIEDGMLVAVLRG